VSDVLTLALDTSTSCLSVALLKDDSLACEINLVVKAGHSGMILPVIDEALDRSSISRQEIHLIAVGIGPGSFTGLRIGIATAKGLAMALGCPLAGIPTLDAIARGILPSPMQIMPILDARKGEVFCALYGKNGSRITDFMNVKPPEITALIDKDTLFIGNGCSLYRDLLKHDLGENYHEGPAHLWHPRASVIGLMALEISTEDLPSDVLPLYVRASDATLILEKKSRDAR
jgi:tRNA threonylcarbamoyladenosine biosynthesis protein TsaB